MILSYLTAKYVTGEKYLCTNGVLLSSMPDEFYQLCAETDTIISITMYPIDLNWDEINRKVKLFGTKLYSIKSQGEENKNWFKNRRDLSGSQDVEENFKNCFWKARCIVLENGRLSSCVVPFKAKYFQQYYKSDAFDTSNNNSIDIFKAKDIEEIVEFLNCPIPCCRYCLPNQEEKIPWGVSKRDISEWF